MSFINVVVKTLDGRNHDFSVPDDINVLQFKAIIHEKMEIAVERQRLLFQGRVLQDDNLLSSYNVAGNVMHLVTRPPPNQNRPLPEINTNEREENSDINRDQIRNILSDVFGNIADLSNPMGVSVNNEGNRVDITVNMPSSNRLSLARLRQNYIHRLMSQARELLANLRDPTQPVPRPDRERLFQANAYDLGSNEERITEVSAQPLPIHNLADMVHSVRDMWRESEPQLELWENVLRRQNLPENLMNSDREMQRLHDSASRYIHLFSHMLHIMSDYLVEFQHNANTRVMPVARNVNESIIPTNEAATSTSIDENITPLTGGFGESGLPNSETSTDSNASSTTTTNLDNNNDRSRYLYVFSEMPAQLLQVRLDVDSSIQLPVSSMSGQTHVFTARSTDPRPNQSDSVNNQVPQQQPANESTQPRMRRTGGTQFTTGGPATMENLFRSTLPDPFINSSSTSSSSIPPSNNARINGASPRATIRNGSQLIDNVDPYVRCQSRHFQNPSNLRSGAVISTFGGIRFRESSRTRPRPTETPVTTANSTANVAGSPNVASSGSTTEGREGDPVRSFIGNLINSIFSSSSSSSGDNTPVANTTNDNASIVSVANTTTIPRINVNTTSTPIQNEVNRILQSLTTTGGMNLDIPLGQMFPEIFNSYDNDTENNITNQIIQLVVNRLTMIDFTQIINGVYHPLNVLRTPLQDLLMRHQQQCNDSRELMLEHVVMDLEFFNRVYMTIFDRLRNNEEITGLSEDARRNFNHSIDIPQTINNLNRHHARVVVDMILRSPTDIGFGQLLMNSMFSHHNESLALLDIICNDNEELRQYMVRAFIESLMSSMDETNDNLSQFINQSRNTFGLDWIFGNVNSRLFRRPDQVSELRETVLSSYTVFVNLEKADESNTSINQVGDNTDEIMKNSDSIEDVVNSLSGNMMNSHSKTEVTKPLGEVVAEFMDVCSYQQEVTNHTPNGGAAWQSVLPPDWIDIVSRDSNTSVDQQTIGIPYSDAYVSGMPPKRRKIILNQRHRTIQHVPELMHDCIDQAFRAAGVANNNDSQNSQQFPQSLMNSFQELVSDHVRTRLVEESFNFPNGRFPSAEQNFNRKKRPEEDKSNNN